MSVPAFAAPAASGAPGDVVGQFGATRFTTADLRDYVGGLDPQTRQQAAANPQALHQMVQLEIIRKSLYNEAQAKNWQQKPDVARQIAAAREAIMLKTYLTSLVVLPKDYPSEKDVQAAYNLNRDKLMMPRQYHLAQIFIASPRGDANAAAVRKKVDDLAARLHANSGSFANLAKQNSQHKTSAANGGDMGWLAETQIIPEMRAKLQGIAKGEASEPIRSDQGWHILRVIDTRPPGPRPLAEVRPAIVASLRQQKQAGEQQQYIARLLQKSPVKLDDAKMGKVLAAAK